MNPVRWWATPSSHNHDNVQCTMMSAGTVVVQVHNTTHTHTLLSVQVQDGVIYRAMNYISRHTWEWWMCLCTSIASINSGSVEKSSSLVWYLFLIKWQMAECRDIVLPRPFLLPKTWVGMIHVGVCLSHRNGMEWNGMDGVQCTTDCLAWVYLTWLDLSIGPRMISCWDNFQAISSGLVVVLFTVRDIGDAITKKKTQSMYYEWLYHFHWRCSRFLIWFVTTTVNRIQQRNNAKRK